jgi:hypothetical protein
MNNKHQEVRTTMDMIKNSFNELGLPVLEERMDEQGIGVVRTRINADSFSMFLEVGRPPTGTELYFVAWFSLTIDGISRSSICQLINVINDLVMDIGHFALNSKDGGIYFLGGIDICDGDFNPKQVSASLKRFIYYGTNCFAYLLRMVAPDSWSQGGIEKIVDEMLKQFSKGRKE